MAGFLGRIVTIFSPSEKRFVNIRDNGKVGRSEISQDGSLQHGWSWERFLVVDGGNRQIALWNLRWRRFLNMDDKRISLTAEKADGALTEGLIWERFRVIDVGDGLIGLWSLTFNRFMRMSNDPPDTSEVREDATMPSGWVGERLQIALLPGTSLGLPRALMWTCLPGV